MAKKTLVEQIKDTQIELDVIQQIIRFKFHHYQSK